MTQTKSNEQYEVGKVYTVKVESLNPNPQQPRKYFDDEEIIALANDIESNGLLQNITFTKHEGQLIIISGERRVRAHKHLKREKIEGKYIEGDLRTLALMENILRSDLTAVELAESVAALQNQKQYSNDEIAQVIGKKKSTVSEILKLAKLPEYIRNDARGKPHMTRERLLKVARRKDDDSKQEVYKKLCDALEKTVTDPTASKSEKVQHTENKTKNRYVTAHMRKIEVMSEQLDTSHKKMLSKIEKGLQDDDKDALRQTLTNMKENIERLLKDI